jgi:hypothetical protein
MATLEGALHRSLGQQSLALGCYGHFTSGKRPFSFEALSSGNHNCHLIVAKLTLTGLNWQSIHRLHNICYLVSYQHVKYTAQLAQQQSTVPIAVITPLYF